VVYYRGYDGYGDFPQYVPVANRRARATAAAARLAKGAKGKPARALSPVAPIGGNKIARSFWGRAWCDNLESYSDYANRLPRGRSYVRHGAVVDLQIGRGRVTALVSGSDMYEIAVGIKPLASARWQALAGRCAGKIDSLVDLLRGRLPDEIMTVVTDREVSLFPAPREIDLDCSCPDWAEMCKHVAATLYGVGARLDERPELLFELRGVDYVDLISGAGSSATASMATPPGARILDRSDLSSVFGIEIDAAPPAATPNPGARGRGAKAVPLRRDAQRENEIAGASDGAVARSGPRREAQMLQGQYMGAMRLLPPKAKVAVRSMREKEGIAAAIELARKLANGERASRAPRKVKQKAGARRTKLTGMAGLVADAVRRALRGGPGLGRR